MPFIASARGSFGPQGRFGRKASLGLGTSGGTITTAGGYRIHTFTTVGNSTFTPSGSGEVEYLIIAGGGGTGSDLSGGGGAGGMQTGTISVTSQNYTVTVGNGGRSVLGGTAGGNEGYGEKGENSSFAGIISEGGGRSRGQDWDSGGEASAGQSGGSGAGGSATGSGGSGVTGQGNSGGNSGGKASGSAGPNIGWWKWRIWITIINYWNSILLCCRWRWRSIYGRSWCW